jgi:hypothetical protein
LGVAPSVPELALITVAGFQGLRGNLYRKNIRLRVEIA